MKDIKSAVILVLIYMSIVNTGFIEDKVINSLKPCYNEATKVYDDNNCADIQGKPICGGWHNSHTNNFIITCIPESYCNQKAIY